MNIEHSSFLSSSKLVYPSLSLFSSFNMMKGLDLNLPIDDPLSESSPRTDLCLELPTLEDKSKKPSGARPYNRSKMPRFRWSYKLHRSFMDAVGRLGGIEKATPKMILEIMDVKGLTSSHIKSHLQLYRNGKTDPPMQDKAEAANANGIKRNIMADPDQMNYPNGTLLPCYYSFSRKSAFDGHPNSTVTTNYLGQIAPTPTIFPPAPWKPVPEKMMMLDGRSNPSGNMFRDFFNGSTSIQGGDGNKMFGVNSWSFSTKSTSSTIKKKDLRVSLELSLNSPISLELTLN